MPKHPGDRWGHIGLINDSGLFLTQYQKEAMKRRLKNATNDQQIQKILKEYNKLSSNSLKEIKLLMLQRAKQKIKKRVTFKN